MAAPAPLEINLADKDELTARTEGKVVRWALTYGKVVLVLTELVVIASLAARFWFYSQIADLTEEIDQKIAILTDQDNVAFEKQFRRFQTRLHKASQVLAETPASQIVAEATSLIPEGIAVTALTVDKELVIIQGKSQHEVSLANLTSSFQSSPHFSRVTVERVTRGGAQEAIAFSLKVAFLP